MIYFENASHGEEGFNTHVMSWTMCIALSNFLDRDFYFDFEIPSSTPPDYASHGELKDKFRILLESPRSLVSDLMRIPNRRVSTVDRNTGSKAEFQLLYSHFATTEQLRQRFEGTIVWDSFSVGRVCQTREELAQHALIEWTHTKLASPTIFFFLGRNEKQVLLDSIKIKYFEGAEALAAEVHRDIGPHYAVHLRLGDYFKHYGSDGYAVNVERFRNYVLSTFRDDSIPVLIATDGLQDKQTFTDIFAGYRTIFIDELLFDEYCSRYVQLEFTDFNALTVLNQLLCASAEAFIGTYRSTFTAIIHRLRQERYGSDDFDFFPDDKVARQVNGDFRVAPDRSGFFDWNRYSAFAEDHSAMSWMREWNRELSTIDS